MARITKLQLEIFNRQLEAYKKDKFESIDTLNNDKSFMAANNKVRMNMLKTKLLNEGIEPELWNTIWIDKVSITSQLMASDNTFNFVSDAAIKEMKRYYKIVFNQLNIK